MRVLILVDIYDLDKFLHVKRIGYAMSIREMAELAFNMFRGIEATTFGKVWTLFQTGVNDANTYMASMGNEFDDKSEDYIGAVKILVYIDDEDVYHRWWVVEI